MLELAWYIAILASPMECQGEKDGDGLAELLQHLTSQEPSLIEKAEKALYLKSASCVPDLLKFSGSLKDPVLVDRVKKVIRVIATNEAKRVAATGKWSEALEVVAKSEGTTAIREHVKTRVREAKKEINSWFPEPSAPTRFIHDHKALAARISNDYGVWGVAALFEELATPAPRLNAVPAHGILAQMGKDALPFICGGLAGPERRLQEQLCSVLLEMTTSVGVSFGDHPKLTELLRSLQSNPAISEEARENAAQVLMFQDSSPRKVPQK